MPGSFGTTAYGWNYSLMKAVLNSTAVWLSETAAF